MSTFGELCLVEAWSWSLVSSECAMSIMFGLCLVWKLEKREGKEEKGRDRRKS